MSTMSTLYTQREELLTEYIELLTEEEIDRALIVEVDLKLLADYDRRARMVLDDLHDAVRNHDWKNVDVFKQMYLYYTEAY